MIGNSAFSRCSGISTITIPEGTVSIGESAFAQCTNLKTVIIHEGLVAIESSTFQECTNLTSIVLPKSLKSIGSYAIYSTPRITFYYAGSEEDWNSIIVDQTNHDNVVLYYNYVIPE